MASWYAIRARGRGREDARAEVAIYDEIGAYGVSAKGFLAELGALPEGTPVDLRLNSPGGSVFDAVAIHNALKRHEGTVTVWIDGIAASAASYIAMAGDEIVMPENASDDPRPGRPRDGHGRGHARHGRGARQGERQPRLRLRCEIRADTGGGLRTDDGRDLVRRVRRRGTGLCRPPDRACPDCRELRHRSLPQRAAGPG